MCDCDDADEISVIAINHAIRISSKKTVAVQSVDARISFGRVGDRLDGSIERRFKSVGGSDASLQIPAERRFIFGLGVGMHGCLSHPSVPPTAFGREL